MEAEERGLQQAGPSARRRILAAANCGASMSSFRRAVSNSEGSGAARPRIPVPICSSAPPSPLSPSAACALSSALCLPFLFSLPSPPPVLPCCLRALLLLPSSFTHAPFFFFFSFCCAACSLPFLLLLLLRPPSSACVCRTEKTKEEKEESRRRTS